MGAAHFCFSVLLQALRRSDPAVGAKGGCASGGHDPPSCKVADAEPLREGRSWGDEETAGGPADNAAAESPGLATE